MPATAGRKSAAKAKRRRPVKRTAGRKVAAFSERFIRQTKGRWAGKPLHLEPWQRALLDELFLLQPDGNLVYREALVGVARKNGKSTLAAAIALYGLIAAGEDGPEVYSAAGSRDQARVVFDQAKAFVEASPLLMDWLQPMRSVITCPANNGVYRVLASDAPLQHGLNPSVVVIDELHAHRKSELYYALTTGQLARENPLVVSITTAGYDPDSICHEVYSHGKEVAAGGLEEMRAERFLFQWYQGADGCDVEDEKAWRAANPSSWISIDDLRREQRRLPEHVFRRLHLNQWTSAEEHWLPPSAWNDCTGAAEIPAGARVTLGVDLGLKHDCAAVVAIWPHAVAGDEKPRYAVQARVKGRSTILYPPGDGTSLSIAAVEQAIRDYAGVFDVRRVMYDPWRFERSAQMLGDEGLQMVEHPMTNERVAPASERLYEAITTHRIVHDGDPILARHVAAGATTDTDRGWRLTKRKSKEPDDALMAMLTAFNGAVTIVDKPDRHIADYRIEGL